MNQVSLKGLRWNYIIEWKEVLEGRKRYLDGLLIVRERKSSNIKVRPVMLVSVTENLVRKL